MTDKVVVLVTVESQAEARKIAAALVEERLAACVNIVPGVRSLFRWEGKQEEAEEVLLLIKSSRTHVQALQKKVESLHSYSVPELICLPIVEGSANYLNWIQESLAETP